MATGGATGFVLHIDDELLNKIQRADSMITDLANKSEQARTRVVEAFREMGDKGVGHFIRKLHEAQRKLDAIGSKTISIDVAGIDKIGTQAATTADQVNKLLDQVNKISAVQSTAPDKVIPNIGQLKAEIDNINKKLTDANSKLNMEQQQTLVNTREFLKQVVAEQQKSTDQRLREAQKLNEANKKANEEEIRLRRKANEENIRSYQKDLEAERKSFAEREKVWIKGFDEYDKKQQAIKDKEKKDAEERNKAAEKAAKENIKARNAQFNAFLKSIDNEAKAAAKADADMVKSSNKRMAQVTANLAKEEEARRKALTQVSAPQGTNTQSDVMMYSYYTYRIKELASEMDTLTRKTKEYEETQKRIASGKGGVVSQQDKSEYKSNLQKIQSIQDQISAYEKLQQAIVTTNNTRMAQERKAQQFSNSMRSYLSDQQYSNEVLAKMRNFYAEEERLAAKAAAAKKQQAEEYKKTFEGAYQMYLSARGWKQEEEALKYLKLARKNLPETDSDFIRKKDALNAAIQQLTESIKLNWLTDKQITENITKSYDQHVKAIAREQKARERLNQQKEKEKVTSSTQNAMQYSAEAKSINEQVQAIKYLKIARDNLKSTNMTEEQYKQQIAAVNKEIQRQQGEVDKLRAKQEGLANSHRNLMDISGQLQRRLALVFSVSQITGYMKQLAEVRGEFELQQKSLQVLLQSKDQADKLWQQTVQLAVQSPFRVSELVSYTRQLAAYRIETGKLFDTTKRLADVSAGLGVDMSRLILAYGQVRAANYLRGTELRQFTEAGIPMLDELAKRFSIMENKAVSAGDVFERISKRMVSFKDVEAVFRSMTDAGGTFYKMQEEQSTTLKGMISNLHDSIDLMLNDIGKTNDGVMKGAVNTVKYIVEHWEMMVEVLKMVVLSYGAYRIAILRTNTTLIALAKELEIVTAAEVKSLTWRQLGNTVWTRFNKIIKDSWKLLKANPMLSVSAVMLYAIYKIYSAWDDHKTQLEDIRKRYEKLQNQVSDIAFNFNMAQSGKKLDEQKKALQSLINLAKNEYNVVIDVDMTGMDADQIAREFNEIKNHILMATVYANEFAEAWARATHWVITDDINEDLNQLADVSQQTYNTLVSNLALIATKMRDNYDKLSVSQKEALKQMETPRKPDETTLQYLNRLIMAYKGVTSEYDKYREKVRDAKPFDASVKRYADERDAAKAFLQELGIFELNINQLTHNLDVYREEAQREYDKFVNDNKGLFNKIMATEDEKQRTEYIKIAIDKIASQNEWNDFEKQYIQEWISKQFKLKFVVAPADQQEVLQQWQETYNEKFAGYEGFKEITETATKQKDIIDRINASLTEQQKLIDNIERAGTGKDTAYEGTTLEDEQRKLAQLKEQLAWLGGVEKDKTAKGKDWFAELAKNIKDANKEFVSLNQTFDALTAKQTVLDKFKGVFGETLAALKAKGINIQLGEIDFTTEEGSIEALKMLKDRLPSTAYKSRLEVEKALSDIQGEVSIRVKKESDEKLKNDVQKLFDQYDLSVELKKINVPKDVAKQLFNIDVTDLDGLRKAVEAMKPQFQGTDMEKSYNESIKKVTDLEAKAQVERAKTYAKYLLKSQSEAVKIKIEELRQIAEIQNKFDGEQAKYMMAGVRMESRQKLQRQQWKDFQNTDMYSAMFGDLENMSGRAIDLIYDKLNTLKQSLGDLPAEDVKEIMTQIKKLEEIKIARDPFGELKKSMQQIRALQQDGKTVAVLQDQLRASNEAVAAAQEQIDAIDLIANARDKDLLKQEMGVEWTEKYNSYLSMTEDELSKNRDTQASILDKQKKVAQSAKEGLSVYSSHLKNLKNVSDKWNEIRNTFTDAASSLMDALVAAGVDADSTAMAFAQMGVDLVDVVLQSVQLGIQLQIVQYQAMLAGKAFNSMLGVIGWIAMALQGITKLFSAIFGAGDKRKQKQIEDLQKQVENLSKAYDKLSESIDNAFSLDLMKTDAQKANQNLQQQINKYNEMIALEEAKKKTDKDKIDEWRDEIASLQDEIAENNKKIVSTATDGILDDVLSASKSFTDAWLEAFQETGEGLTGLESEFKDMMQSLVKQQASMIITQQYVNSWKKSLEQFINPEDLELTTEEAKRWVSTVTNSLPQLNQALENYFNAMQQAGVNLSGESSGDKMSGLQRGIESLSEATGEILASYLNSIRFFVSEQNSILSNIANSLGATNTNNPMLGELKLHTELIRSIRDGLNSMMRGGHRLGGMGLKIFMD